MSTRCDRCFKETSTTTMSYFNTDIICMACKKEEREHPDFKKAMDVENQEVKKGNCNFAGIGKPSDL